MQIVRLSVSGLPGPAPAANEIQIVLGAGVSDAVEHRVRRLAGRIASWLGLQVCPPGLAGRGLRSQKVDRVRAFIEAHLAEPVRVAQIADAVHMSPFHFTRVFKQATGESPHAYLTSRRMDRAKFLLSESDMPLVDVAATVGFQTQGHFTEVFRRRVGITPRRYRVSRRGRNPQGSRTDGEYLAPATA